MPEMFKVFWICTIFVSWTSKTALYLFYFRFLTVFWQSFREIFTYLCCIRVFNRIQVQGQIPVKASQMITETSIEILILSEQFIFFTELQLQSSDVIYLQEGQEKFLLILSGYLLETTYNLYT